MQEWQVQTAAVRQARMFECPMYEAAFHNFVRVTDLFFFLMIWRYNLHTIKCTLCRVQSLVFSDCTLQLSPKPKFTVFLSTQNETPYPLTIIPNSPFPPTPNTNLLCLYGLTHSEHYIHVDSYMCLLRLASFSSYCWIIVHGMDIACFVYPFNQLMDFGVISNFGVAWKIHVQGFVWTCYHFSSIHFRVKLSHMVTPHSTF